MWRSTRAGLVAAALGQVILMGAALALYRWARHLVDGRPETALANARSVWDLERALFLPDEAALQEWALRWDGWVTAANHYYVKVHFPLTGLFLAWIWWRHRAAWPRVRAAIIGSMALSMALHALYPLAPPRLLPSLDMVDLMNVYGPSAYAHPPGEGLSNQFAAMPSMHVGWALLVAWGVVRYGGGRWRWLAVAHPVVTTLVVVLTANHYWLDGIVGSAIIVACLAATLRLERSPEDSRRALVGRTAGGVAAER
ncbi:MAG TPA: phosphatase PAP2 family protein [Thermomonospora sp.]|nr:phosphatase PAP2 family protein [Thermomonospora sp.]